jgi:hypothetical protein
MQAHRQAWVKLNIPLELLAGLAHPDVLCVSPRVIDTQFTDTNQGWVHYPDERWQPTRLFGLTQATIVPNKGDASAIMFVPVLQLIAARGKAGVSPLVRGWLYTTANRIRENMNSAKWDATVQLERLTLTIALALEQGTVDANALRRALAPAANALEAIVVVACLAAGVPVSVTGYDQGSIKVGTVRQRIGLLRESPYTGITDRRSWSQPMGIPNVTGWLCFFATSLQCLAAVNTTVDGAPYYKVLIEALRRGTDITAARPELQDQNSLLRMFAQSNDDRMVGAVLRQLSFAFIGGNLPVGNRQQDLVELVEAAAQSGLFPITHVGLRGANLCRRNQVGEADPQYIPTLPLYPSSGGRLHTLLKHGTFNTIQENRCTVCHEIHAQPTGWHVVAGWLEKGKALVVTVRWPQNLSPVEITPDRVLSFTDDPTQVYVLRSVALHVGTSGAGHYTAVVELANGTWAEISDDRTEDVNMTFAQVQQLVRRRRPAAFFYERTYD